MPELVFDVAALDYVFPAQPRTCVIGAAGGTLGRDARNTLVLPDRYQRVSRLHAEITFVRGVPILSNKSRTLVVTVGEQEVLPGDSAIVQDEDIVEVGPYLLSARVRDEARPAAPMVAPAATAAAPVVSVSAESLMLAFTHGAGMPADALSAETVTDTAELIGGMLRHAVQGAMDLLVAGAITQREIRVNTALVAEQSNNPLRFLPTAESALVQLLTGQLPGFMHGTRAMPHAFADLLAHDAGVMAGMHAALADMMVRLDPRAADASLSHSPDASLSPSPSPSLSPPEVALIIAPSADKARWWDTQNDRYARVAAQAEDNFDDAFGRVFVDAYSSAAEITRTRTRTQNHATPRPSGTHITPMEAPCHAS